MGRIFRRFDSPKVLDGALVAAARDAEALLRDARTRADALLAEAERLATERARAHTAEAEGAAFAKLRDASHEAARLAALAEPELVELALAVTARVVAHTGAIDPTLVHSEARRALASLSRARALTVTCHADDLEALDALAREDERIHIEVDATLERGDVIVRSDIGRVDARLRVRLDNVARALGRRG